MFLYPYPRLCRISISLLSKSISYFLCNFVEILGGVIMSNFKIVVVENRTVISIFYFLFVIISPISCHYLPLILFNQLVVSTTHFITIWTLSILSNCWSAYIKNTISKKLHIIDLRSALLSPIPPSTWIQSEKLI